MAKTTPLTKATISDWNNVAWALHRACRGKTQRPAVKAIQRNPEGAIDTVSTALRHGCLPVGSFRSFTIYDPKKRLIHAAPLLDRIAHHAIVRWIEPTFERILLPSVFACRVGRGVHASIYYAQQQSRRYRWVLHMDIKHYFPNINHKILAEQLRHRFRGDGVELLDAVIASHAKEEGKGLPIGALTSQHFANHYLNIADRWSLAQPGINAHCRYMDDFLFWANDRKALTRFKTQLATFLESHLALTIKPPLLQRTDIGIRFCGVHIKPYHLRPSLRRRRRYARTVEKWEEKWQQGEVSSEQLQRAYDAAKAILLPADEIHFRQRCLQKGRKVDA